MKFGSWTYNGFKVILFSEGQYNILKPKLNIKKIVIKCVGEASKICMHFENAEFKITKEQNVDT